MQSVRDVLNLQERHPLATMFFSAATDTGLDWVIKQVLMWRMKAAGGLTRGGSVSEVQRMQYRFTSVPDHIGNSLVASTVGHVRTV